MTSSFDLDEFTAKFTASSNERADVVMMARMSESAERYEDMCQFMKYLVINVCLPKKLSLTVEERNLLSVAYKNVIGTRRASWRTLSAEQDGDVSDSQQTILGDYHKVVETELVQTCTEVLDLLERLVPASEETEAAVFYLKMAGDYYRYLAESVTANADYPQKASSFYKAAYERATQAIDGLVPTHPIRLGLALNYSVCFYEVLKDKQKACELAKAAFDDAISKLDKLEEADYKDSTLIMQLLRDNLTLWSSSDDTGGESVQVEDLSDDEN